jgi:hypothetical protein
MFVLNSYRHHGALSKKTNDQQLKVIEISKALAASQLHTVL